MGTWQLVLVGLVMLLGLLGVVTPGVPGPPIVWAGVLWWSMTDRTALAWAVLAGATGVLLLERAVGWLLPHRSLRGAGVTRRAFLVAGACGIAGFFVVPVLGAVPGFIAGLYGVERRRLGGHSAAWASTRNVMRAVGTSVLVELFACLLVVGMWIGAVTAG
ncbi:DUF456 domain-containing protein [Streptomyces rectiverticillatus]|uniref:DUF456 domain-containing protein n=1 Tax=Streptomyces rectiverticillatus TaxID=173860 RepID=UPI0015C2EEA4|nr:DUF456 domain-containing protein [Streptomyces rectiverticillatus]QLE74540.1 DUF456 domain-containing protein [Streptomyces rectiverticillatus]